MWQKLSRCLDTLSKYLNWVPLLTGGGVVTCLGGVSAWIASKTTWIVYYGPIAWWISGLVGALIGVLLFLGFSVARYQLAKASAVRQWAQQVDSINPLDTEFTRKRINVLDLVNPITNTISSKRFIDCELIGPANLGMINSSFSGGAFNNCDLVMFKPGNAISYTVKRLENVQIIGGSISNCTIFVNKEGISALQAGGIKPYFLSMTGIPAIDNQVAPNYSNK